LKRKIKEEVEDKTKNLATKADLAANKTEIIKWMFISGSDKLPQRSVSFYFI